jgi:molecular chaperone HscB
VSDPFDILGLAPRYDLELELVETRHRALSRVLHPDRHASEPPGVRRQALSSAIAVNEAFRVLSDPVLRAEALLLRLGVKLEQADEKPAAPAFLMQVLELREELADAQHRGDAGAVERLGRSFDEREATIDAELCSKFGELGTRAVSPADVDAIGHKLGELRFVRRLHSEAAAILDEL